MNTNEKRMKMFKIISEHFASQPSLRSGSVAKKQELKNDERREYKNI